MKFRTAYDPVDVEDPCRCALVCDEDVLTIQSEKENCDINVIVRRFGVTQLASQPVRPPMQGDFSNVGDFRSAMDATVAAQAAFDALPATTRARFGNDPQMLMQFVGNKDNLEEARKLGLAVPAPPKVPDPVPMKVEVVNPTPVVK